MNTEIQYILLNLSPRGIETWFLLSFDEAFFISAEELQFNLWFLPLCTAEPTYIVISLAIACTDSINIFVANAYWIWFTMWLLKTKNVLNILDKKCLMIFHSSYKIPNTEEEKLNMVSKLINKNLGAHKTARHNILLLCWINPILLLQKISSNRTYNNTVCIAYMP